MKRKKFIALLCVAATSASLVTPVMAEENETSEATNTVDTYTEDGLYEENGEVYYYKDGTMATGERTIGGKKYWFTGYGDWIR